MTARIFRFPSQSSGPGLPHHRHQRGHADVTPDYRPAWTWAVALAVSVGVWAVVCIGIALTVGHLVSILGR